MGGAQAPGESMGERKRKREDHDDREGAPVAGWRELIEDRETMPVIDKSTGKTIRSVPAALRFAVEEMAGVRMAAGKP
jgi:hypothetical protein